MILYWRTWRNRSLASSMRHSPVGGGVLRYQGRLFVLDVDGLKGIFIKKLMVPDIPFIREPQRCIVIFETFIIGIFWKRDISDFVAKWPNCQQVKPEHQRSGGITQVMDVHTWKWEDINMDFVVSLPRTRTQNGSLWVIVDRFAKSVTLSPSNLLI